MGSACPAASFVLKKRCFHRFRPDAPAPGVPLMAVVDYTGMPFKTTRPFVFTAAFAGVVWCRTRTFRDKSTKCVGYYPSRSPSPSRSRSRRNSCRCCSNTRWVPYSSFVMVCRTRYPEFDSNPVYMYGKRDVIIDQCCVTKTCLLAYRFCEKNICIQLLRYFPCPSEHNLSKFVRLQA